MKQLVIIILAMASLPATASKFPATVSLKYLSPELSTKAVSAAMSECTKRGFKVGVSLTGRSGNLLAFSRNPLSGPHTVLVSQKKAFTSATTQQATWDIRSRKDLAGAPGILIIRGAVPIQIGGTFYGAIGVSGADPKIDEVCAKAGVDAIRDDIEFGAS